MTTGTVKWFNPAKGFGFIEPEDGSTDAFVHISAVERAGMGTLSEGQKISYDLQPGQNGKSSAENLKEVSDDAGDDASDDDLLQDPPKLPASSWLEPHVETVVYVGQSQALEIEIKPTVRFIGVLGLFNEEQGDHRALLSVDDIDDSKLVFDGFRFTIEPRGEGDEANG